MIKYSNLLTLSFAVFIAVAAFNAAAPPDCLAADSPSASSSASPAASYSDCIKSYNELKTAIESGADEKTIKRLSAAYKEKLAVHENHLAKTKTGQTPDEAASQPVTESDADEASSQAVMEGDTDKAAGAQVVMSKTMRELEAIKNELRFDYNPAKVEKIIAKLNEIIKTHPAGSPEAERAAFELAGVQIKKKDFSSALKTLETLKNLKSNAVNDSDVKNLVDYAAVMNKKKNAAPLLNAGINTAPEETIRAAVRIDESTAAPEGPECGTTDANTPVRFDPAGFEGISRYKPIAEWTGRLILPLPAQREPDGSIFIEIHNAPRAELIGKIIRLRWDLSRPEDAWFEMIRTTVNFDPKRLESERSNSLVLPLRLNGWPAVSALESLAGARPHDDVEVILKEPVYTGGALYINREPAQICGSHKGLVRFEGSAKGGIRLVRHYNPASGSFDGASESIKIAPKFELASLKRLVSTTADIEKSPQNEEGWYIYGTPSTGGFVVKALEPRSALALLPSKAVSGRSEVKYYFSRQHFSNLAPSLVRSSLIATDTREWMASGADELAYCDKYWPVGKKGIVVHLFGWHEAAGEKKKIFSLPVVTGHFSFGIAEVVIDPFTGEKRFDIEYKQVYAHNNTGIISGSLKWHNYMGDLKRGWMYSIPVSDTIIQVPELEPYDINGWKINPVLGFSRMAEIMTAVYRTGAGSGISSVRPDVSCVQDSHYVLYGALMTFEKNIKNSANIFQWLRGKDPLDKNVMRFFSLDTLVSQLKDRVTILGLARGDWKNNFENPIGTRNPNIAQKTIRTLLSLKTVFPRDGNDNLIFFAANRNYRMWSVLTAMCGGRVEGLKPIAPTSVTRR